MHVKHVFFRESIEHLDELGAFHWGGLLIAFLVPFHWVQSWNVHLPNSLTERPSHSTTNQIRQSH